MLPVIRTELAEADLARILDELDQKSPAAAERLASNIDDRCNLLSHFPEMGRARDELAPGVRSVLVKPYVLFYRVTATAVEILRILHGAQDIESIMRPEEDRP